ncbi:MAG TPA: PilZ domain-containing protein [Terriglobales bacterium]|jgi:CheY-like chemotaxis protein|nr:PilZ domain-containing protein [Terriglobales bacterium]
MPLQALLFVHDPEALRVTRQVLDSANILCQVGTNSAQAIEFVKTRRFDALVVDCDDMQGGKDVLQQLRSSPSSKRAMAFAIINGGTTVREAFDLGANFVLDKPLTVDRVTRTLRAAQGLMKREQRRYFRNSIETEAQITLTEGKEMRCRILNLSEGGMAVKLPLQLQTATPLRVRFFLPGGLRIEAKAETTWHKQNEGVGIRFLHMDPKMQRDLEQWLSHRFEAQNATHINATTRSR